MLKPIREDTRENQLLRALYAIEFLAEYERKYGDIYHIDHDVSWHCRNCANGSGVDVVEVCEVDAKAKNIYDVEKLLERVAEQRAGEARNDNTYNGSES